MRSARDAVSAARSALPLLLCVGAVAIRGALVLLRKRVVDGEGECQGYGQRGARWVPPDAEADERLRLAKAEEAEARSRAAEAERQLRQAKDRARRKAQEAKLRREAEERERQERRELEQQAEEERAMEVATALCGSNPTPLSRLYRLAPARLLEPLRRYRRAAAHLRCDLV